MGDDSIGHHEKKVHMNMCLILNSLNLQIQTNKEGEITVNFNLMFK